MKLFWIGGLLVILFTIPVIGQKLTVSKRSPTYTDIKAATSSNSIADEQGGFMPNPVNYGYSAYFEKIKEGSPKSFPLVYDLRNAGPGGSPLISPVKAKLNCGCCWSFSTIGAIESNWIVNGYGLYDLSENNLKNCHGFIPAACSWGHHFMTTAYLNRGSGPVLESQDPYSPTNGACISGLTPTAYIPEAQYPPEDNDAIKEILMTQGSIHSAMYYHSSFRDPVTNTYFYSGGNTTNHSIELVGWNDTMTTAGGTGAWIAKNNLGPQWADGGFFYIAYQDTLICKYNAIYPERWPYDPDLKIYQYDLIGGWPMVGYNNNTAYGLVKYIATDDQILTHVGTYMVDYGGTATIEVFDSFTGGMLSGKLGATLVQSCDNPGYYTYALPQQVFIQQGNDFYIKIKYVMPGVLEPMAIEEINPDYTNPEIETGKFWASSNGVMWDPIGLGTVDPYDLCIKALAKDVVRLNLKIYLQGPFNTTDMTAMLGNDIPLSQPFHVEPWNYSGTESVPSVPNSQIVDWLLLELRETPGDATTATSSTVIARKAVFLKKDGSITGLDGSSYPRFEVSVDQNLFVVIYHRNHLPVMSAEPLIEMAGLYSYNFTDNASKVYGGLSGYKQLYAGIFAMVSGDGDANFQVNNSDKIVVWKSQTGLSGYLSGDFNLDRQVNNADKVIYWKPNSGMGGQLP